MKLIQILNRLTDCGLNGRIIETAHTCRRRAHVHLWTEDLRVRIEVMPSSNAEGRVNVIARRNKRGTRVRTLDRVLTAAMGELTRCGLEIDEAYVSRMRIGGAL